MVNPNNSNGLIRPHATELTALLRAADIALIWLVFFGILSFRGIQADAQYIAALLFASVAFLIIGEIHGVYRSRRGMGIQDELILLLGTWFWVVVTLLVGAFSTKSSDHFSRLFTAYFILATPVILVLWRMSVRRILTILRTGGRNSRSAVIAGAGELATNLAASIEQSSWMGINVVGYFDNLQAKGSRPEGSRNLTVLGNLEELIEETHAGKYDYVYIALPMTDQKQIKDLTLKLADTTASVFYLPDLYLFELMRARVDSINGFAVISVYDTPFSGVNGLVKRAEDLISASLILLVISVPMLLIALGVKLTSPGSILFKQRRYGLNGDVVEVWKFRSMCVSENGETVTQAQKNDARVTRFGAFLRKTSLDELPQFINVLQGRMSVVGPRPHAVAHNEQYRSIIHGYMLRHKVKPGITGWAQINGWRGETDTVNKMEMRVKHDLDYIRNWSVGLDLKIVLLTVVRLFTDKTAY